MIRYRLKCGEGHGFEAWFKDSKGFDKQAKRGLIECPACGGTSVAKDIMAPAVPKKGGAQNQYEARAEQVAREILKSAEAVRKCVEETCDYVGPDFPEEARKIHHGEAEERGIYGEASLDDARELNDEGIEIRPLPVPPRRN